MFWADLWMPLLLKRRQFETPKNALQCGQAPQVALPLGIIWDNAHMRGLNYTISPQSGWWSGKECGVLSSLIPCEALFCHKTSYMMHVSWFDFPRFRCFFSSIRVWHFEVENLMFCLHLLSCHNISRYLGKNWYRKPWLVSCLKSPNMVGGNLTVRHLRAALKF